MCLSHVPSCLRKAGRRHHDAFVATDVPHFVWEGSPVFHVDRPFVVLAFDDDEDLVAGDWNADGDIDLALDVRMLTHDLIIVFDRGVGRSELFMDLVYRSFEAFPLRLRFFVRDHVLIFASSAHPAAEPCGWLTADKVHTGDMLVPPLLTPVLPKLPGPWRTKYHIIRGLIWLGHSDADVR